jgi:hypothetical protein
VQSEMRGTAVLLGQDALIARKVERLDGHLHRGAVGQIKIGQLGVLVDSPN